MIEASFEAVVPKAINAEFEAIIPREKAFDIVNKDIHIDTNGKYEVKAEVGTAMTQVNVEVEVPNNIFQETMIDNTGKGIKQLNIITLGADVTKIGGYAYQQTTMKQIFLSNNLETIGERAFHTCQSLTYISPFPETLKTIGIYAFSYTGVLKLLDFRNLKSIPALGNADNLNTKTIVVPDALYDDWIVATNWVSVADKIVKASEFVEPTTN